MPVPEVKVCIVSPNTSLKFGGEASFPWFYFKYMRARGIDAHLVTHGCTQDELDREFASDLNRVHTIAGYFWLDQLLWRAGHLLPGKIDSLTVGVMRHWVTQLRMKKIVRDLVKRNAVNVLLEPTPISPKHISAMYGLGIPVVMGPLSGGMTFPPAFRDLDSTFTRFVENAGRAFSHVLNFLVPGKIRAEGLIVANQLTRDSLPLGCRGKIYDMPEVGVDLKVWNATSEDFSPAGGAVHFVYLGRLVDWKGVRFLLDAFKIVATKCPNARLEIVGDGPERIALEQQAAELGISGVITFHGYLLPNKASALMRNSDALVLPSLHECGGVVVLEAMGMEKPVVATNWAGPATHVTDETGIRVDIGSKEQFVNGLAEAMIRLANSPDLRRQMGKAGKQRLAAEYYDWDRKVDRLMEIFRELMARQATPTVERASLARTAG